MKVKKTFIEKSIWKDDAAWC
ncbi:hypothetical protein ACT7C4_24385 [Bacillus pacificus]